MDMNDFNAVAKRTETGEEVRFDVRPFGDRQGEAIDSYAHDLLAAIGYGVANIGDRLIVVVRNSTAVIPQSVEKWLAALAAAGVAIEVREVPNESVQQLVYGGTRLRCPDHPKRELEEGKTTSDRGIFTMVCTAQIGPRSNCMKSAEWPNREAMLAELAAK